MSLFDDLERRARQVVRGGGDKTPDPGRSTLAAADQHADAADHRADSVAGKAEDADIAGARRMLEQTKGDPDQLLLVIRGVLEKADLAPPKVAFQLLQLLVPFGRQFPAVTDVVHTRLARLEHIAAAAHAGAGTAKAPAATTDNQAAATSSAGTGSAAGAHGSSGKITPAERHEGPGSRSKLDAGLPARQAARRQREWEEDKTYPNFRDEEWFDMPEVDLFKAISAVDPSLPLSYRRMMVGQVLGEQSGRKPNRNFMGFELGGGGEVARPKDPRTLWTRAKRSDEITVEQFHKDEDKYYDNPYFGHTIQEQLDHPEKRPKSGKLNVMWYSPRQAYDDWDVPAHAFHAKVLGHYRKLKSSPYPEHQALAALAFTDPDAYIDTLELNSAFDIRAADAPKTKAPPHDVAIGKMSYNGTGSYKKTIMASVQRELVNGKLVP